VGVIPQTSALSEAHLGNGQPRYRREEAEVGRISPGSTTSTRPLPATTSKRPITVDASPTLASECGGGFQFHPIRHSILEHVVRGSRLVEFANHPARLDALTDVYVLARN
jgi:hypothetical protein